MKRFCCAIIMGMIIVFCSHGQLVGTGQAVNSSMPETHILNAASGSGKVADINYMDFYLFIGENSFSDFSPVRGDNDAQVIFKNVPVHTQDYFLLKSKSGNGFFAKSEDVLVNKENPLCDLYYNSYPYSWEPHYGLSTLNGIYDIVVNFEGEKASLKFNLIRYFVFNPEYTFLVTPTGSVAPTIVEEKNAVYKDIPVSKDWKFYLYDRNSHYQMGWLSAEGQPATPESPSVSLDINAEVEAKALGFEGSYDIKVKYNDDMTSAIVTFCDYEVPEAVANYTGDLYIYGEQSDWKQKIPEMKMTCKEPGVYEWKGKTLKSNFYFNAGSENKTIEGTDLLFSFGGVSVPAVLPLEPNKQFELKIGGRGINFCENNKELYASDVTLTVNLKELTLMFTGKVCRPVLSADKYVLFTEGESVNTYQLINEGKGICFENIPMDNVRTLWIEASKFHYGWSPWLDYYTLRGDEVNTELYTDNDPNEVREIDVDLEGSYNIYAIFNDDITALTEMTLRKTGFSDIISIDKGKDRVNYRVIPEGIELLNCYHGEKIDVFSLTGFKLVSKVADSEVVEIKIGKGETYIIRNGDNIMKIRL